MHSFKATEKLIRSVCDLLSARTIFGGCSFMRYLDKKVEWNLILKLTYFVYIKYYIIFVIIILNMNLRKQLDQISVKYQKGKMVNIVDRSGNKVVLNTNSEQYQII